MKFLKRFVKKSLPLVMCAPHDGFWSKCNSAHYVPNSLKIDTLLFMVSFEFLLRFSSLSLLETDACTAQCSELSSSLIATEEDAQAVKKGICTVK